jgi:hypothetical protein
MPQTTANFESGVNGNTITTSDPGSATAWDAVTLNVGTATYDNTHAAYGALAGKFTEGGTGSTSYCVWSTAFGTQTDHYTRLYAYLTANPANNIWFANFKDGATRAASFAILTDGTCRVADSGSNGQNGTAPVVLNQWIRIELHVIHSATVGQLELQLFYSPESLTPTETVTSPATWNTLVQATQVELGITSVAAVANSTIWLDDIVAAAPSYPGPYVPPPPPTDVMLPSWSRTRFNG